ncbi:MAG: alkaline phosphatase, partial [Actinobacteria bacterium]|nr:alkaline phosphatase [Actinomycetota bacterium]
MQRTLRITAALGLFAVLSVTVAGGAATPSFKNVIVLVVDGCGSAPTTVARWVKGAPLALDRMHLAGVRTYGAESIISDSAPAATAFACGHKTSDKFVGMLPDTVTIPGVAPSTPATRGRPVASVLDGARLSGRATGIVATSQVQHATPAAYTAHTPRRSAYDEIAEQQVYLGIDVVLGGGRRYLLPPSAGGTRTDGDDLVAVLRSRGTAVVETREAMLAAAGPRLWGAFAPNDMAHEL